MKAPLAVVIALLVTASAIRGGDERALAEEFTKEALSAWCDAGRTEEDVKREFGPDPMITGSFEEVEGEEELLLVDTIRFTYGVDELPHGRFRRAPMSLERPGLIFRFRGHLLIEVSVFYPLTERPNRTVWEKKTEQNQPVDPTSGTRPAIGKSVAFSRSPASVDHG